MLVNGTTRPQIAYHTLRISDPSASLHFYQTKLGMTLVDQCHVKAEVFDQQHFFLGFYPQGPGKQAGAQVRDNPTLLELIYRPEAPIDSTATGEQHRDGYWKIGLTLDDVNAARVSLMDQGVTVTAPEQFFDIGFLCHLYDTDGYCIELLQRSFAQNHIPQDPDDTYALASAPTFGQVSLRIRDPSASLDFYTQKLGMRLLSRQVVKPFEFTLYFLGYTDELLPNPDIDAVDNREWLWQRPYTTLELQHRWGEADRDVKYCTDAGFHGITVRLPHVEDVLARASHPASPTVLSRDAALGRLSATIRDPDGYLIRLV